MPWMRSASQIQLYLFDVEVPSCSVFGAHRINYKLSGVAWRAIGFGRKVAEEARGGGAKGGAGGAG